MAGVRPSPLSSARTATGGHKRRSITAEAAAAAAFPARLRRGCACARAALARACGSRLRIMAGSCLFCVCVWLGMLAPVNGTSHHTWAHARRRPRFKIINRSNRSRAAEEGCERDDDGPPRPEALQDAPSQIDSMPSLAPALLGAPPARGGRPCRFSISIETLGSIDATRQTALRRAMHHASLLRTSTSCLCLTHCAPPSPTHPGPLWHDPTAFTQTGRGNEEQGTRRIGAWL